MPFHGRAHYIVREKYFLSLDVAVYNVLKIGPIYKICITDVDSMGRLPWVVTQLWVTELPTDPC